MAEFQGRAADGMSSGKDLDADRRSQKEEKQYNDKLHQKQTGASFTLHSRFTGLSATMGQPVTGPGIAVRPVSLNLSTSLPERTPQ